MEYTYRYPHPAVATDCVVFGFDNNDLNVLLIRRGINPYKDCWAFPGGFIKMDETAEEGVRRELEEETGLTPKYVEQFHTFSTVDRDPRERVISIAFFTLVNNSDVQGGDDAAEAKWFKVSELPKLAFDHQEIFHKAKEALQHQVHFEPICFELMDESFSMPSLQRLYEAILETQFDRRNFQKKILQLGILSEIDEGETASADTIEKSFTSKLDVSVRLTPQNILESQEQPLYYCWRHTAIKGEHGNKEASWTNGLNSASRRGKRYKFNKEQYEAMKARKPFRLEF